MFRGTFTQKIDEKGRVSVPARFREVLDGTGSDQLFVTNFRSEGEPCLDVYPYAKWLELEARLREPADRPPRVIKFFQNFYFPGVQECQIDKQGRILLMPRLREYAGLDKEVIFAGVMDKLRIFSVGSWEKVFTSGEQSLPDEPEVLKELGV
jgi:MraZ protein